MPTQKNLNVSPYYDDFDPKKNYYRVLYKAGYPIQARELTTQQSILQDQVEKLASRILAEGDNVVPGEYSLVSPVPYVRLSSFTNGATVQDFVGFTVKGVTSGVVAEVTFAEAATNDDDATLYVSYTSSGETQESTTFLEGEVIESSNPNAITASVGVNTVSKPVTTPPMGQGALFRVTEGSYFIDGCIVRNDSQKISVSKYTTRFDAKVGFLVTESFVSSNTDASLLDNAQGSSNFAAPGADRLKIELTLVARPSDVSDPNFVILTSIVQGNVLATPGDTVKWDWLYDILARRTFDESGNYMVSDFGLNTLEYHNSDTIDGLYDADADGKYPAVPGSESTDPITYAQADDRYVINMSSGKAYVQGYEIDLTGMTYLYGNKSRTTSFRSDTLTQITEGYNLIVTNVYGTPDFQNITGDGSSVAFDDVVLYRNFGDGFVGEGVSSGRPLNLGNKPWKTFHILADGDIGSNPTGFTDVYKQGTGAVVNTNQTIQRGDTIGNAKVLHAQEVTPVPSGVISPRYMLPNDIVDGANGFYGYNSTYQLGIMSSVYFTQLSIFSVTNDSTDWTVGNIVEGEESGATGTVEEGSNNELLVLSGIVGEFKEGEEVVQANKVSRITTQAEVYKLGFTDKGTGGSTLDLSAETGITVSTFGGSSTIELLVAGNDITVSATEISLTESGRRKLRNFPYPEGSVQSNQKLNFSVTTAPSGVKGFALYRTPKIVNTLSTVKNFFSPLADTNDFSADISIQNNADAEIINIANDSLFSGDAGSLFLTCDNYSGNPSAQLVEGDIVTFVDDNGASINRVVSSATVPVGYGEVREPSVIRFTVPIPASVSGRTVQRIRIKTRGNSTETLLYQLPQEVVATLETDPENTQINYQVLREFIVNVSSGASTITLTTNKTNETFISNAGNTAIFIAENNSSSGDPGNLEGRSLTIQNIDITQDNGRKVVFSLEQTLTSSVKVKILVPVFVTDAISRRKIARTERSITVTASDSPKSIISLQRADVYNVHSVMMGSVNILDNYEFDDGQRDNIYDISRLTLKPGRPAASGTLTITYDFFEHSGDGDFFSADSYTADNSVGYKDIPTYTSENIITQESIYAKEKNKNTLYLRDAIDFRPSVNTTGANPSVIISITDGADAQDAKNYRDTTNGGNSFTPRLPLIGTQFACDLEYYLPRYDSVYLQNNGALALIAGDADLDPVPAPPLAAAIKLYDLFLPPYVFDLKDIFIQKFNYKRYQMKDIAAIDRRVERMEELVTLSLLEQDAINMNVRDASTGLDRYKNGIVVDNFSDHGNGDTKLDQYRCSIDNKNSQLRSPYFIDQLNLEEGVQTDTDRENQGYAVGDGIITCKYDSVAVITQNQATRQINLQPYSVFTYDGTLQLFPEIDTFSDQNKLPDLVIEDNSLFNAMNDLSASMNEGGFGTVWSRWETSGSTRSRTQTTTTINTSTASVQNTSYGERVTDVQVADTMRTIPVGFFAQDLKPNTRYYAFFDDIEVSDWVVTDTIRTDYPDGVNRYDGEVGGSLKGFGQEILSDAGGSITGVWLVPSGRAPEKDSTFDGNLLNVQYKTSGPTRSFSTGSRPLRFTTNKSNPDDLTLVEGICEREFTSSGVILDTQETVVSTRIPQFNTSQRVTDTETQEIVPPVINNITNVTNNIVNIVQEANDDDPVAQTFTIDSAVSSEGAFVTEIDLFFKSKDFTEGVQVYLTTTAGQVPTETVLPHSFVTKNSDTTLRVQCTTLDGTSTQIANGTKITGQTSGATGIIKSSITFESSTVNSTTNVANHVYNVVLNNYNGDFLPGEVIVPDVSPALVDVFRITQNQFKINRVDIAKVGSGYTTATVVFSAPQLPGGVTATGTAKVANGIVYQVDVTNFGSGYTDVPSVTINGDGTGATATVKVENGRQAVDMGVATSVDASVPTTFKFKAPVYLFADTYYAVVAKAPSSLNYTIYTAKMGENLIGTSTRVLKQPTLGSLFMSQNGGLWTEDQTQDMTFVLRRAKFATGVTSNITFVNPPISDRVLLVDPIEFNNKGSDTTSNIFGDNPQVVKVYHHMHGLAPGDLVAIDGVTGDPGGIPIAELNTVHTVVDADLETFTVKVTTSATSSGKAGGNTVRCSYNRPYEVVNVTSGVMNFANTAMQSTLAPIQAAGVTGYNTSNQYTRDSAHTISFDESYYYTGAKQVANFLNEAKYFQPLGGRRSFFMSTFMNTGNDFVSPVIDLIRTNATVVRNLINSPVGGENIFGTASTTVTFTGDVSAASISSGDAIAFTQDSVARTATAAAFNSTTKKLRLTGQHSKLLAAASTFGDSTLQSAGIKSITTMEDNGFFPETDNRGSAYSKWISRLFEFEQSCDGVEIKMAAIFYSTSDIKVYYKPRNIGFDGDFGEINWRPFNGTGLPDDVNLITARSSENVDPNLIPPGAYQELTFSIQDIPKFDGISVKIVMTSSNPALAPLIDDIRIVCSE